MERKHERQRNEPGVFQSLMMSQGAHLPLGAMLVMLLVASGTAHAQQKDHHDPSVDLAMLVVHADEVPEFAPRAERIRVQRGEARIGFTNGSVRIEGQIDFGIIPSPEELRKVNLDEASELVAIIERLGDSSFEVREKATEQLKQAEHDHVHLYAVLEQLDLSAEQRIRLLDVVRDRVLHAPRGAIGISMQRQPMQNRPMEVIVTGLIEGLPAGQVLHVDDRITHIDGERVRSSIELTSEVQARRPGDMVRLTLVRPEHDERGRVKTDDAGDIVGEQMDVEFELGSAELLIDPATGERQQLQNIPHRRHQEVAEAYARYGDVKRDIELNGEFLTVSDAGRGELDIDALVDNHTFIRRLREERRLVEEGHLRMSRQLRESWELRQRVLMQQLEEPGLTPEERDFMQRVLYRYTELLVR